MTVQESVGPAVRRQHRRTKPAAGLEQQASADPPLPPALESLFGLIATPVLKLESAPDGQRTLREIGILLGDVLDLIEESPSITQAADWLYEAAFELQQARAHQHSSVRFTPSVLAARAQAVHRPLASLRKSLGAAKPSARARARRLVW